MFCKTLFWPLFNALSQEPKEEIATVFHTRLDTGLVTLDNGCELQLYWLAEAYNSEASILVSLQTKAQTNLYPFHSFFLPVLLPW